MEKINIYGLPNCDSTKKAITWLKAQEIDFTFHDYKTEGINKSKLEDWCRQAGWENLLNKKSTTWRSLNSVVQSAATNRDEAIKIMMNHNSIVKRPVIEFRSRIFVGFNENELLKHIFKK